MPGSSLLFPTIGAALAYWQSFPVTTAPFVIAVCPGIYHENLVIDMSLGRPLWLISTAGPDCTIIDGGGLGPCVTVLSSGAPPWATFVLGHGEGLDPTPWRGFTLRNGLSIEGGGIAILDAPHPVHILGNRIGDPALPNRAEQSGGGIFVSGGTFTQIAYNVIAYNQVLGTVSAGTPFRGAGVAIESGSTVVSAPTWELQGNQVHENSFLAGTGLAAGLRQGGGVSGVIDFDGVAGALNLCRNVIFQNTAIQGMGIYLYTRTAGGRFENHLFLNEIHENSPWLPSEPMALSESYRGGGLFVDSRDRTFVALHNNKIRQNSARAGTAPWGGPYLTGTTGPAEAGGGIYAEALFAEPYPTTGLAMIGNFIHLNVAENEGGGAYLGLFDVSATVVTQARIHNNTIAGNSLPSGGGQGSGIHLPAHPGNSTVPFPGAAFDASSNILRQNVPIDRQWYAEPPLPASTQPFRYSHMPPTTMGSANLYGPDCEADDPRIVSTVDPHLEEFSPCIDRADPALLPLDLVYPIDLDENLRFIDVPTVGLTPLDRGADEFLPEPQFIRGDVNGTGAPLNVADPVFLLAYLYSMGPLPCPDAADFSDDGSVNLLDAILLLHYVYGAIIPPVVAAPHPLCGVDPTPDSLGCLGGTACP